MNEKFICETIKQKKLEHREYIKYLGVVINSKLSWKSHTREILEKICHSVKVLAKMRHYANTNILTNLYYAIIYPFLIYGMLAWGSMYPTTLKSIVILQKKAVQIAYKFAIFHQLSIPKLPDLGSMHTAPFMFDFYHNAILIPSLFSNCFTSIPSYNTRWAHGGGGAGDASAPPPPPPPHTHTFLKILKLLRSVSAPPPPPQL